jgi:acyl-CoA synthetase (AMP-forming)/AMP-acid ligase II
VTTTGANYSHRELGEMAAQIAATLRAAGIMPDNRVALLIPDGAQLAVGLLGVMGAATAVPLNPALPFRDLKDLFERIRPQAVVTPAGPTPEWLAPGTIRLTVEPADPAAWRADGDLPGTVAVGPPPEPDAVALLLHTSGTTSLPKPVPLTHRNLSYSAGNVARWFSLGTDDRGLAVMPLFHIHGIVAGLLAPLAAGGTAIVPSRFDPLQFFAWLDRHRPTWYSAVPTMHQLILARAPSTVAGMLRFVRSSSAPLPPSVMERLEAVFAAPAIETLGMTEASHQVAANPLPPGVRKPRSVGVAAGAEIRVLAADGSGTGEIAIRGPGVFDGYGGDPGNGLIDGWFPTGDLGRFDDDGYLFLVGRLKELINRGGEKVAPVDVEAALLDHPAVAQAAAFAVADRWLGEEVAAVVVLSTEHAVTEGELIRHARARLPAFKVPRSITITDRIPVGATGKVARNTLAATLGLEPPR